MNKGFGDSSHQKFPQATKGLHPIKKLILEQAQFGDKSRVTKFLKRGWKELSARAWKGYLELGRGALFLTIDDLVLAGGNYPVEYVNERECFNREVMSGYHPMGEMTAKVNTYDPNREVVTVLKWRSRQGYLVTVYRDALTTPKQNYQGKGLQADPNRFPLSKKLTDEQAAKNAKTHPLARLAEENWELWAAVGWSGYLSAGRGVVAVLLGQNFQNHLEKMDTDLISTVSIQEIPASYFELDSPEIHSFRKSSSSKKDFLDTIANYNPQKSICLCFDWDDDDNETPSIQMVMSNEELPPHLCYEHLAERLNEFTQEK